jgi:hypothetical protein
MPDSYQGSEFLMLGNLAPAVQISVIRQMKQRPRLIAMDTMNFWMDIALPDLKELLTMVDVLTWSMTAKPVSSAANFPS